MSNTFQNIGYVPQEPNDPAHADIPNINTLIGETGIEVMLVSGTSAQNVWINHNTFRNDANVPGIRGTFCRHKTTV